MKTIEEMADAELAARWMSPELSLFYDSTGAVMPELLAIGAQMAVRLSMHPAQRIADLSGCVVTSDYNYSMCLWTLGVEFEDLHLTHNEWRQKSKLSSSKNDDSYVIIGTFERTSPWQESIYKPQVNVRNGGKYESASR